MSRNHTVATVVCAGALPFELAVTAEVFGFDRSDLTPDWYEWKLCVVGDDPIPTLGGMNITSDYGIDDIASADTVIVSPTSTRTYPDEVIGAVRAAHDRGARIVSLCSGVFALAEAGVIDGCRVTTHWMHADQLAREHPSLDVDPGVLYVDDGAVLTSAGTAASIDLCLHLVREDFGADIANAVARRMVVPPHRDGGQAQYVDHPIDDTPGGDLLADTLIWAEAHLAEPITVEDLAARSAMSPRTFARRFGATTGTTPHHWITRQRVHLARQLLETTDLSVEHIASECGLGTSTNLRLHFQRIVKTTPSQYRRTFRLQASA